VRRRHRPRVVVYTRQGCGLCAAAEARVADEARRADVELVDVDADPELQRRYHVRVPVVAVDGVEVAEVQVAPGVVRRAVRAARRAGARGHGPGARRGR
jgi:glutaredoxin